MSNLTPEQIKNLRENRFKNIGLPKNAGKIADNNPVIVTNNKDMHQKLQSIKRGANKNNYKRFVQVMEGSSASGYQIPEVKKKRVPQEKSKNAVEVQTFNAPRNVQAESIEKMFTGNISSNGINFKKSNEGIVSEGYGPDFDPINQITSKTSSTQDVYQEQNVQNNIDLELIKEMMYKIAENVSHQTVKTVINEFVEKQKKKNMYEVYNKEKNIVKINNKLYKLTPVKIKDH
jgi:hypothetical protein